MTVLQNEKKEILLWKKNIQLILQWIEWSISTMPLFYVSTIQ